MADENLLEPIRYYRCELSGKCREISTRFFDELHAFSGVDEKENRKDCRALEDKKLQRQKQDSRKTLFTVLGIICIVAIVAGLVFLFATKDDESYAKFIAPVIAGMPCALGLCVLFFIKRKRAKANSEELSEQIDKLQKKCDDEMRPLNTLFDYSQFLDIATETLPAFKFNKYTDAFFIKKMSQGLLGSNTPLHAMRDSDTTVSSCLSGLIDGKMFAFLAYTRFYWGEKTYRGELLITWREYDTDSEGHRVLVTRSEVLVAFLTKPFPMYRKDHCGLYYSQAAPKLSFARHSTGLCNMSEKKIASFVKKQSRRFEKEEKRALRDGRSWTQMSDVEFEALFNASSRDNDVEFRLLFTPYCIKNYLEMFKAKDGLSDSFTLIKKGCINLCDLDATLNQTARPQSYEVRSHSFDIAKVLFISRCESFFRELFFTLAPFFMIPVYAHSLDERSAETPQRVYDSFDVESIVAAFEDNVFRPQGTVTDVIKKSERVGVYDFGCLYTITATAFYTVPRVEFVPQFGGDGRMHNVPVHWLEYLPRTLKRDVFVHYAGLKESDIYSRLRGVNTAGLTVRYKDGLLGFALPIDRDAELDRLADIIKALGV